MRLFRHRKGRYERFDIEQASTSGDNEVHEHVLLNGRAEYLDEPMEHYAFPDIETFIEKHNRYSSWEAQVGEQRLTGSEKLRGTLFRIADAAEAMVQSCFAATAISSEFAISVPLCDRPRLSRRLSRVCLKSMMAWYERMIVIKTRELGRKEKLESKR